MKNLGIIIFLTFCVMSCKSVSSHLLRDFTAGAEYVRINFKNIDISDLYAKKYLEYYLLENEKHIPDSIWKKKVNYPQELETLIYFSDPPEEMYKIHYNPLRIQYVYTNDSSIDIHNNTSEKNRVIDRIESKILPYVEMIIPDSLKGGRISINEGKLPSRCYLYLFDTTLQTYTFFKVPKMYEYHLSELNSHGFDMRNIYLTNPDEIYQVGIQSIERYNMFKQEIKMVIKIKDGILYKYAPNSLNNYEKERVKKRYVNEFMHSIENVYDSFEIVNCQ